MTLKILAPTYYTRLTNAVEHVPDCRRLLNVGCSDGEYDKFLRVEEIYGIDINSQDIETAKKKNPSNHYVRHDIEKRFPFRSDYFDCIICIDVLEHIEKYEKTIKEMARVAKKDATIIISVPSQKFPFFFDPVNYLLRPFDKKIPIGVWGYGHLRLFDENELKKKLKKYNIRPICTKHLSHNIVGLFENSYIANFAQRFVKSDPGNKNNPNKKNIPLNDPPKILCKVRDIIIKADAYLCKEPGLGFMIISKKS